MKLATLKSGSRDGVLVVVDRALKKAVKVPEIANTLQAVLDDWDHMAPRLHSIYQDLNGNRCDSIPFDVSDICAPLPRAFQWLDGSAYLSHVERVRKARGAEMPASFAHDPLMYQGGSDSFLAATDAIAVAHEDWGIDFEAEVAVITDDVESGIDRQSAESHIKLIALVNDISLRRLIPSELAKGFGFLHGKPSSALSPVAVSPDEIGKAWYDSKLHYPLNVDWNDKPFGRANAGDDMQFDFAQLIAHAAKTRSLGAGTIIGSGTVSNRDTEKGCSCIVERRMLETLEFGEAKTEFMGYSDRVRIEMLDDKQQSIFGAIDQQVIPCR